MLRNLMIVLPFCVGLTLPATAQDAALQPEPAALQRVVAAELPGVWTVGDIAIVAQVNDGDAIDPRWRMRFEATATLAEPLYQPDRAASEALRPFLVLIETQAAQTARRLFGTARASYAAGAWEIAVNLENAPERLGLPRDMFDAPTLVAGTEETEIARARLEAAEALAEEIAAEREARRISREADLEALRAEQRAAETALSAAHEVALAEISARQERTQAEMTARQSAALSDLESRLAAARAEMEAGIAEAEAEMQALAGRAVEAVRARAEAVAIAEETEALAALTEAETARAAQMAELEAVRAEAIRAAAAARAESLDALRESLDAADPDIRRVALAEALTSGEPVLERASLAFLLAQMPELALEFRGVGTDGAYEVQTLVIAEFDPETGDIKGNRFWHNGGTDMNGTLLEGRITFGDRFCKMTFDLDPEGVLAGDMSCRERYEAVIRFN